MPRIVSDEKLNELAQSFRLEAFRAKLALKGRALQEELRDAGERLIQRLRELPKEGEK